MRYFIWFSYDGTQYHGWQIQPNGVTVQSELQRCLSLLLREEVTVTGAGRTDTGVHARRMAAQRGVFCWNMKTLEPFARPAPMSRQHFAT